MLLAPKGGPSYLVGRKFGNDFYKIPMRASQPRNTKHAKPLDQVLSSHGNTLLDGEIVLHESGRIIFLIFDVVELDGKNFANAPFSIRKAQIGEIHFALFENPSLHLEAFTYSVSRGNT
jgi:hypothetical protein